MEELTQLLLTTEAGSFARGRVAAVLPEAVVASALGHESRACDVLETGVTASLTEGDIVLVWLPPDPRERGVVLGRVRPGPEQVKEQEDAEELVLEAKKQLTLKCGSGSITIREDGKILIKGKDLVSHAQRLNRIKGGAVQIN